MITLPSGKTTRIGLGVHVLAAPALDGELAQILEVRIEFLDTAVPRVGDIDIASRPDGDTHRLVELTLAGSGFAERGRGADRRG